MHSSNEHVVAENVREGRAEIEEAACVTGIDVFDIGAGLLYQIASTNNTFRGGDFLHTDVGDIAVKNIASIGTEQGEKCSACITCSCHKVECYCPLASVVNF